MRAISPLESRLRMPRSQANHTQAVCITCTQITFAGRNTLLVLRFALALVFSLELAFRHNGDRQTTLNKTHKDAEGGSRSAGNQPPREPPPHASLPSKPHTSCVYHLHTNNVCREERTACIAICSRPCV